MRNVKEQCEKILSLKGLISTEVIEILDSVNEPGRLADLVASNLRFKIEESQKILETFDPAERLKKINEHLSKELEVSTMQAKIQSQAKEEMTKTQREYFLREQLKAIKSELGDIDEKAVEISEFSKKIKQAKMPAEAEKEAKKQLTRLEQMHADAAEASIVRTYLDWMVEIPWSKATSDNLDIKKAKKVLDDDHYNLEKVKERILEYLAVRKLKKKMKGPILCFVGPPGWVKPHSANRLLALSGENLPEFPWGEFVMRPKSGGIAEPISEHCRAGSFKGLNRPAATTRCL